MYHRNIAERLFDADVRIEKLFFTAALCASPSSDFEEFFEDDLPEEEDILEALPKSARDCETAEDLLCELSVEGSHGFFIQLSTPRPRDVSGDGSYISSWGNYRLKWVFLRNLGDVAFAAEKFRDEVMDEAKLAQAQSPA